MILDFVCYKPLRIIVAEITCKIINCHNILLLLGFYLCFPLDLNKILKFVWNHSLNKIMVRNAIHDYFLKFKAPQ